MDMVSPQHLTNSLKASIVNTHFCRRKSFCGSQTISRRAGQRGALLAQPVLSKHRGFSSLTDRSPAATPASGTDIKVLSGQQGALSYTGWYLPPNPHCLTAAWGLRYCSILVSVGCVEPGVPRINSSEENCTSNFPTTGSKACIGEPTPIS